jgi:glycosyltransferase involved in cell wall biosynthesis
MKILLLQGLVYVPTLGGANKSNRLVLEELAARGHQCRAVAPACGAHGCDGRESFREAVKQRGIPVVGSDQMADVLSYNGVQVTAAVNTKSLLECATYQLRHFNPDWVIVGCEDFGQFLLEAAVREGADRVLYLARTTLALPFGPDSPARSERGTDLVKRVKCVVTMSEYLRSYIRQWSGLDAVRLPLCPNGPGPFLNFGATDGGYVTLVNPCAYKGISIFVQLARQMPSIAFAAVPTWGTTRADTDLLEHTTNVTVLQPSDNIDDIFAVTRVLLVPSLWAEAKARLITEAMLRGVPVLASDAGGNKEALLGCDYLLPVQPIIDFETRLDERLLPVPIVPDQDIAPWRDTLAALIESRTLYKSLSHTVRAAALAANSENDVSQFEAYLCGHHRECATVTGST